MIPSTSAWMRQQSGLVLRSQALDVGVSERDLRTLTAVDGPWVVVRRGVYVEREQWQAGSTTDQMVLRDVAAHLTMVRTHTLSHDSSGRSHRLAMLRTRRELVHVTRPGVRGARTEHGVKHHLYRTFNHIEYVGELPVHDLARTTIDIAREHGVEPGVVVMDQALRRGTSELAFAMALGEMAHWPHITRARHALSMADAGADSPAESLLRVLVTKLGHGVPTTQFPVRLPGRTVWCDLRLGRHTFEIDGHVKYVPRAAGGLADRPAEDIVWEEKVRDRDVNAEGLGVSRIVWDDMFGRHREQLLNRLQREYLETRARFGTELPEHLARYAAQLAAERRRRIFGDRLHTR